MILDGRLAALRVLKLTPKLALLEEWVDFRRDLILLLSAGEEVLGLEALLEIDLPLHLLRNGLDELGVGRNDEVALFVFVESGR